MGVELQIIPKQKSDGRAIKNLQLMEEGEWIKMANYMHGNAHFGHP